ncbi:MAG TPA: threonine synthase, partial [Pseudomonadales bacterium]|nr:threonine synthase [Pseudomonadales bacterium]
MKYRSTRGGVSGLTFKDAVIMGLADDGGLLVPEQIPDVTAELDRWENLRYAELAFEIMRRFVGDIPDADLAELIEKSYATFDDPRVTPVRALGQISVLELFHGPTLAFKDVA